MAYPPHLLWQTTTAPGEVVSTALSKWNLNAAWRKSTDGSVIMAPTMSYAAGEEAERRKIDLAAVVSLSFTLQYIRNSLSSFVRVEKGRKSDPILQCTT